MVRVMLVMLVRSGRRRQARSQLVELRRGRQVVLVAASAAVKGGLMMDLLMAIGILRHVMRASATAATSSTASARAHRSQRTVIAVVTGSVSRHGRGRSGRSSSRVQRIQLRWQVHRDRNGDLK